MENRPINRLKAWLRGQLAQPRENDSTLMLGAASFGTQAARDRDRVPYDREETLRESLEAWRTNPLARRIVGLVSQYVVGGGIDVTCKNVPARRFIAGFWNHRLNRMPARVYEWCDELSRSGNLFILISTDAAGMSYVRAVPAAQIERITPRPNDIEQPLFFHPRPGLDDPDPQPWPAYDPANDAPESGGGFAPAMLHYAVNRPCGAQWGEPDLGPALKWLSRYANWLEDRARLNRYRNAFVYVVRRRFSSEAERQARQRSLNASPPTSGSILVTDENEEWMVLDPKLDSGDAASDGLALKKMVAAGSGLPLHFLAEPESATRTTAEASGGPTFRHFEQRQEFFLWLVSDVLQAVLNRRALVDSRVNRRVTFSVSGSDISSRDNQSLASSAASIVPALADLRGRRLIDDAEYLRLFYRFAGESADLEEMLARGRSAPRPEAPASPAPAASPAAAPQSAQGGW
jgi:hypothetical protein